MGRMPEYTDDPHHRAVPHQRLHSRIPTSPYFHTPALFFQIVSLPCCACSVRKASMPNKSVSGKPIVQRSLVRMCSNPNPYRQGSTVAEKQHDLGKSGRTAPVQSIRVSEEPEISEKLPGSETGSFIGFCYATYAPAPQHKAILITHESF